MNTKQIVALVVGIVAAFAALMLNTRSETVSSRPITTRVGVTVMEEDETFSTSGPGFLWPAATVALTVGAVYLLRTRPPA